MEAALHTDLAEFAELVRPMLEADPVAHTVALTVIETQLRVPLPQDAPLLLTVHHDAQLAGTALCTPPRGLLCSGLPPACVPVVVELLAEVHPALPDVNGPRLQAEAFAHAWSDRTGAVVRQRAAMRLFALGELCPPVAVTGAPRQAECDDVALLARWRTACADEATGGLRGGGSAEQQTRRSLAAGNAALLWEVDGRAVAWASASAPVAGMSRIGPVYTEPRHRGHGFGSAVTAAAAAWALRSGARDVVLFTDLANPVSNAIYPRLGFRPVHDAVEIAL